MNIEVTQLPGIGVRKDSPLSGARRRIGIIDRKDRTIDPIVSNPDATEQIPLSNHAATGLANLLGAPQLHDEHREFGELATRQLPVRTGSPDDGRLLGDTQLRTRTSMSIVAVMRAGHVIPSPGPEFLITAGDVLVVVGTAESLTAAARIMTDG